MPPLPIRQEPSAVDVPVVADAQVATDTVSSQALTSEAEGQEDGSVQVEAKKAETRKVPDELRAWVVQIGSFTEQGKANALRDRMRTAGFKAFVEYSKKQAKPMYRVRVGPHLERSHAELTLGQLQEKSGVKGYVTRHP
jgi:cell division septation protein DedD